MQAAVKARGTVVAVVANIARVLRFER